jgi:hypothetical protein
MGELTNQLFMIWLAHTGKPHKVYILRNGLFDFTAAVNIVDIGTKKP